MQEPDLKSTAKHIFIDASNSTLQNGVYLPVLRSEKSGPSDGAGRW